MMEIDDRLINTINLTKNGSNPAKFGPSYWDASFYWILQYPVSNPSQMQQELGKQKLYAFAYEIGCKSCSNHTLSYLMHVNPVTAPLSQGRVQLFVYWWEFKNTVNQRLNKPMFSIEQAVEKYASTNNESSNNNNNNTHWQWFVLGMVTSVVAIGSITWVYSKQAKKKKHINESTK